MALVSCKECGGQVSDKAQTCPHCGIKVVIDDNLHESPDDSDTGNSGKSKKSPSSRRLIKLGTIAGIVMVISVFLPWVEGSASSSVMGYSSSFSTGRLPGTSLWYGWMAISLGVLGVFFVHKEYKFSIIIGVIAILDAIALISGWLSFDTSISGNGFSAQSGLQPLAGLYIFALASVIYLIATLKYIKGNSTESAFHSEQPVKMTKTLRYYLTGHILLGLSTLFLIIGFSTMGIPNDFFVIVKGCFIVSLPAILAYVIGHGVRKHKEKKLLDTIEK